MTFTSEESAYHLFRCHYCDLEKKKNKRSGKFKVYTCNYKLYLVCIRCGHKYEFKLNQ